MGYRIHCVLWAFISICALGSLNQASVAQPEKEVPNKTPTSAEDDKKIIEGLRRDLRLMEQDFQGLTRMAKGYIRQEEGFRGIYAMNADGGDVKYLVAAPDMLTNTTPSWSHDGKMILFDGTEKNGPVFSIFVCAIEGPYKGLVRVLGTGQYTQWSPDDRRVAFAIQASNDPTDKKGVWIMNSDGTERHWVCEGTYPRWSRDGKSLIYREQINQISDLRLINLDTNKSRSLLSDKGWTLANIRNDTGAFSRDDKRVAFVGAFQEKEHLATIDLATNEIQILRTNENAEEEWVGAPAWSPNGQTILFSIQPRAGLTGNPRLWWKSNIYAVDVATKSAPALVEEMKIGNINRSPAWSPDGKRIVFSSER